MVTLSPLNKLPSAWIFRRESVLVRLLLLPIRGLKVVLLSRATVR
jgi:hypothetical protein